jgi:uncharacterized membrane protein (DUF485 family)
LLALAVLIAVITLGSDLQIRMAAFLVLVVPVAFGFASADRMRVMQLWALHIGAFLIFTNLRAFADDVYATPFVNYVIALDRMIGFGTLPTVWLQDLLYVRGAERWWDRLSLVLYASHFVNMWFMSAVLGITRSRAFAPFMVANALLYLVALLIHFIFPTAPPWLASHLGATQPIARLMFDIGAGLSPELYERALGISGNDVAAMPSIHIGVTWLILLASRHVSRPAVAIAGVYAALMVWSVVYGGEHYVVDGVAGIALAWLCWRISRRIMRSGQTIEPLPKSAGAK